MDFKDKRVLIMGLGIQGGGAGVARFFVEKGAIVTVTDLKTKEQLSKSLEELESFKDKISFVLGRHREEDFKNVDLIIRNPDVPRDSPYLKIAKENNIPIEMDESLFLKLCPSRENVIGVTGTRGKTTTTHLIGEILKKAGFHTLMGGNLRGVATLSLLDQVRDDSKIVLELSSWQLQGLSEDKTSPHISVITNIFEDHLNRYKNMDEYVEDKKIIFKYQNEKDYLVLNKSHETNKFYESFAKEARSKIIWFSKGEIPQEIKDSFKLKGEHNLENLTAAYKVAKILDIDDRIIEEAMRDFKGVKFRLEEIANINGVTYVNDTTSTTPVAAIAALKAYSGKPIVLICGGFDKKLDLSEWVNEINRRVKAVVLLKGTGTDELISNFKFQISNSKEFKIYDNFKEAVLAAKTMAQSGNVVLLSPGFASFGLFRNEFDRGEQFNEIVKSF